MRREVLPLPALTILFAASLAHGATAEQIDRLFAAYDTTTTPGCMVAVIKDGEVAFMKGYGMADIDAKRAIDEHTLFNVVTLSRHFTGAAAASLIDNGAVRLTDSIRVTIPEMPRVNPPIRVQDLIYHTSGMPDYVSVWKKAGAGDIADTLSMIDLLSLVGPEFAAGSRFRVSGSDYLLLGFVAQRVTSLSLAEWAQNVVFRPAGMGHSVFGDHPDGLAAGRAVGYRAKAFGGYAEVVNPLPMVCGDTGLWTTVEDLAAWEKVLVERKVFSGKFFDLLESTGKTNDGRSVEYAFGLNVEKYKDLTVFVQNGAASGFSAGLMRFPGAKLTVLCVSNVETLKTAPILRKIADLYLGGD